MKVSGSEQLRCIIENIKAFINNMEMMRPRQYFCLYLKGRQIHKKGRTLTPLLFLYLLNISLPMSGFPLEQWQVEDQSTLVMYLERKHFFTGKISNEWRVTFGFYLLRNELICWRHKCSTFIFKSSLIWVATWRFCSNIYKSETITALNKNAAPSVKNYRAN